MFAKRVWVVVCCAAFACAFAVGDDPRAKPAEKAPKKPVVIPIEKAFDLDEIVKTARKLFPADTVIVPLPGEHALLTYLTDEAANEMRKILGPACADKPAPAAKPVEKTFAVDFKAAKGKEIAAWYADASGLKCDTRSVPVGPFTVRAGKDRRVPLAEVTDLINEQLMEQGFYLIRGATTFVIVKFNEKIDLAIVPAVEFKDLTAYGRTELVEVAIPLKLGIDENDIPELKKLLSPFGEFLYVKGRWLVMRDTVGNILRIVQILGEC